MIEDMISNCIYQILVDMGWATLVGIPLGILLIIFTRE